MTTINYTGNPDQSDSYTMAIWDDEGRIETYASWECDTGNPMREAMERLCIQTAEWGRGDLKVQLHFCRAR